MADIDEVLGFWFGDLDKGPLTEAALEKETMKWFRRDADLDRRIAERFGADIERAGRGELDAWAATARGRLALIVLLDQFPRNINRESPLAFATDARALAVTLEGLKQGAEAEYNCVQRFVFYMPLMHAEDMTVQRTSVDRFRTLRDEAPADLRPGLAEACGFAERHYAVVERFGRYPHRNKALSRPSTPEEVEFLKQPGSSF
jgi:uncharacterized protein (DUF924 family)